MKVTKKLLLVALLLSLILSIGAVTAQDNITFEKSNLQDISTETINQIDEQTSSDDVLNENNEDNRLKEDVVRAYEFSDIQSWINSASEGETIYLNGEYYSNSGNPIDVTKNNITIIGGSQSNPNSIATLDANGISSIMNIAASNVVIKGIKFINGYAPIIQKYNMHEGSYYDESTDAGAIDITGSNCKIMSCSFINNAATRDAGVIKIGELAANNIIDECVFENNRAREGGAIFTRGVDVSILNSNFTNNRASVGGAIKSTGRNAIIDNCNFINNSVAFDGGVIGVSGFNSTIINSNFINSSGNRDGGAISINGDNITVKSNKFIDSHSGRYGGAIFIYDKNNCVVENNRFLNSTAGDGADIWIKGMNNQILSNSFYGPMGVYEDNPGNNIIENNAENVEFYSINVNSSIVDFVGRTIQIPIYITDILDTPISGTVTLYGWGDQTLVGGKAMFIINLPSTPTVLKSYVKYGDEIKNITIESIAHDSIESISQNANDDIIVKLSSGATGTIIVNINGVNYIADAVNGTATVRPKGLVNGEYTAIVLYSGDDEYSNEWSIIPINITQSPVYKLTQNKDINVMYSGKASYKVLVMKDGKPVAGENVVISFNGKNNNVKTDANGYATLNLDTGIKPGSYNVKTTYNGVSATNKVNIKQIIKASDKKVKKSAKTTKVKISLSKVDGKYLKGKTLKVKFNGKTYKVKTNSKGVGIWKVKKSMIKKLKVGKKVKYTITYGKDALTKKLIIKK